VVGEHVELLVEVHVFNENRHFDKLSDPILLSFCSFSTACIVSAFFAFKKSYTSLQSSNPKQLLNLTVAFFLVNPAKYSQVTLVYKKYFGGRNEN
jgi:hypothetical protein